MSTTFNDIDGGHPINSAPHNPAATSVKVQALAIVANFVLLVAIIASAAVAGFFYAYACSVMYGLNDSNATVALEAMQGINRTVRNPIFALSFFGTALLLPVASVLTFMSGAKNAGTVLAVAALSYLGGGFFLTMAINVPMNNALALVDVSALADPAKAWADYEQPWSFWNWVRTGFSFAALILAVLAFKIMPGRD
ncbi:MAG: anthrone oxygenase family protein [Hyphomicrobiales bacterium]